ncbi:MAG: DNA cytosine methyltransferase [Lentisphaerota bacterium]
MKYGSVCSGVDAATLAWEPLGWKCKFFSEIEPFPSAVLAARWPKIPNLGDFTKINGSDYAKKIDLLTGGTPCQSFSVAGHRAGLADERGNLACEFARLAFESKIRWLLWENVPGVLSSNKGRDFADFLSILAGWRVEVPIVRKKKNGEVVRQWRNSGIITPAPGGFGLAWRVLDAQFVRVDGFPMAIPQRRRRLFIIGYTGDWRYPATVLFDKESLSGNHPPFRKTRQGTACGFEVSPGGGHKTEVSCTLDTGCKDGAVRNQTGMLCMSSYGIAENVINRKAHNGGNGIGVQEELEYTLTTASPHGVCCFVKNDAARDFANNLALTLRSQASHAISYKASVRRLTPIECERLMGFPDNHTRIPWKKKAAEDCPDGPRYRACGNSQCVNVMRWLGMRIEAVDKLLK